MHTLKFQTRFASSNYLYRGASGPSGKRNTEISTGVINLLPVYFRSAHDDEVGHSFTCRSCWSSGPLPAALGWQHLSSSHMVLVFIPSFQGKHRGRCFHKGLNQKRNKVRLRPPHYYPLTLYGILPPHYYPLTRMTPRPQSFMEFTPRLPRGSGF